MVTEQEEPGWEEHADVPGGCELGPLPTRDHRHQEQGQPEGQHGVLRVH